MKFTVVATLLGLAAASPFTSSRDTAGLEDRGGKCAWKDDRCCELWGKYDDKKCYGKDKWRCQYPPKGSEHKSDDWGNGYGHDYHYAQTIYVKHPKSIQKAIDKASPGDKIVVGAGIYHEQLTINKDGIELVGKGAVLVPPTKFIKNKCSGLSGPHNETGICITGSGVQLDKFITEHRKVHSVKRYVKDVSVTGFTVNGFSGINIAVVGAINARVVKNTLIDGARYGSLTAGSVNTLISGNTVTSTGLAFIGICMDNKSGVLISNNKITNHVIGLCVQTKNADVQYNNVTASCFGVFVDPGTKGAKIHHNYIGPTNPFCVQFKIGASGMILDGAVHTEVRDNLIEGQTNNGFGAGIVVVDDDCTSEDPSLACITLGLAKAVSTGNVIVRNKFIKNDYDIFLNTTGTNVVQCNKCTLPTELCAN